MTTRKRSSKAGTWPKAYVTYSIPGMSGCIEITPFVCPPTTESLSEVREIIADSIAPRPNPASVLVTNWLRMAVS